MRPSTMTLVSGITRDADEQPGVKFRSVMLLLLVRARSYVTVTAKTSKRWSSRTIRPILLCLYELGPRDVTLDCAHDQFRLDVTGPTSSCQFSSYHVMLTRLKFSNEILLLLSVSW